MLSSVSILRKSWLFTLSLGLILLLFAFKLSTVHAQNISIASSAKNCDANAVVWCGVSSVNDIISEYQNGNTHNSAASIANIYSYFGITAADVKAMNTSAEQVEVGSVSVNGDVYGTGNTVVATNALTAGRENISGSNAVTSGGTAFYTRAPSVSFAQNSLPAFVVMKNGQFAYAILASCGNPIKATPKVTSTPTPAPAPKPVTPTPVVTKPAPTPVVAAPAPTTTTTNTSVCSGDTTNINTGVASQGGNCSVNTTTTLVQTTPAPPASSGQCTSLAISFDQNNPLEITATANSDVENGAQLVSATFDFGDGTTTTPSSSTTQSYTYNAAGTYVISATLIYSGTNGQTVPNATCQASVYLNTPAPTATTPPVTPPATTAAVVTTTPTASTTLVNTGPGDVVALFGISAVIGSFGYKLLLKRIFS